MRDVGITSLGLWPHHGRPPEASEPDFEGSGVFIYFNFLWWRLDEGARHNTTLQGERQLVQWLVYDISKTDNASTLAVLVVFSCRRRRTSGHP